MLKIRVAFAYPVKAVLRGSRKEQTFFLEDAIDLEARELSRAEVEIAVEGDVEYRGVLSYATEILNHAGQAYRATRLRTGQEVVSDLNAGFTRGETRSFLGDGAPWSWNDDVYNISGCLPLNVHRVTDDGRERTVDLIRDTIGRMVLIDGVLHKPAQTPVIWVSHPRDKKQASSLNLEERPLLMHWNFPLDHMNEARRFLEETSVASRQDLFAHAYASRVILREFRPELLPRYNFRAMMADVAATTFIFEAREYVARMRPEGFEALARLARLRDLARHEQQDIAGGLVAELRAIADQGYFLNASEAELRHLNRYSNMARLGLDLVPPDPKPELADEDLDHIGPNP